MREAIVEELNDFNFERIWELAELKDVKAIADAVHVRTRWVLCNKADSTNPNMRARLVACEINKTGKEDVFFASTPPGASKHILFSRFAHRRHVVVKGKQVPLRLSLLTQCQEGLFQ